MGSGDTAVYANAGATVSTVNSAAHDVQDR
jgi:hypothetical protein